MPILNATHFTGPLAIPGAAEPGNAESLAAFIELHEPEFLRKVFGVALASEFTSGIADTSPIVNKWVDLRDGKTYSWNGSAYSFDGVLKPLTAYVFYWWCRKQSGATPTASGGSSTLADGSAKASLDDDMKNAWNNIMRPSLATLYLFLQRNPSIYPEWREPDGGGWRWANPVGWL